MECECAAAFFECTAAASQPPGSRRRTAIKMSACKQAWLGRKVAAATRWAARRSDAATPAQEGGERKGRGWRTGGWRGKAARARRRYCRRCRPLGDGAVRARVRRVAAEPRAGAGRLGAGRCRPRARVGASDGDEVRSSAYSHLLTRTALLAVLIINSNRPAHY